MRHPTREPGSRFDDDVGVRWIYHLLPRGTPLGDAYAPASLASEGYVHGSYREAVQESARLHFPPGSDLVVLQLDPRKLTCRVEEAATPRGPMPHLFGPVQRAAVARVLELSELDAAPDEV
jgi:uncharacterized protein (DUF952 family)